MRSSRPSTRSCRSGRDTSRSCSRAALTCVLVLKDEHGRLLAAEEVKKRDKENVKPFLERFKKLGLRFDACYIDGCKAYYNAIGSVFGAAVAIESRLFPYRAERLAQALEMGGQAPPAA
jgi:hypothetical protein